ncbi:hypothetical protein LJC56_03295 [Christensenellaceae bacterium OttesenSCG-928-K19]|nr:hypothetical protein [Christensenellaceae bacterium OttesenSCG-928-K19]
MNAKSENLNPDLQAKGKSAGQYKMTIITIAIIAVLFIILNVITGSRFLTGSNMLTVLTNSVVPAFVVLGFCFIFTMGITDLSVGAIMILASNIGGILAVEVGLGYFGLFVGGIGTAVLLQLLNMKLMLASKIPPWILGIGMTMVYEAIASIYNAYMIGQATQVVSLETQCRELGQAPWNIIVLAAGLIIAYLIYNRTNIGFGLRAVGSNREVTKMMGINVNKAILLAGLVGGIFLGLAAIINSSYSGRVMPTTGLNSIGNIFTPLAAFLLASALQKAFNLTIGAIVAAFLITALFNVLTLMGVPSGTMQRVVMGASVLICGIISQRGFKGVVK